MKPRVLLHAMTFNRDFGFVYCLAKVLEGLGCETMVCSNTDYVSRPMRWWQPDVVFYVTIGRTNKLRQTYSNANLVLWNAESCRLDTYPPFELQIAGDQDCYHGLAKVLLWGKGAREMILQQAREQHWNWIVDDLATFERKFVPVGHPRLDLARYANTSRTETGRTRIGFIGFCSCLNNIRNTPVKNLLDNYQQPTPSNHQDRMYFEAKYLDMIARLINTLDRESFAFSLRPYPLENSVSYHDTELVRSGRLALDRSIEFTSWIKQQDLIIGPTSTTMYLMAASRKAYINVDLLLKRQIESCVYADEYLAAIPGHCPRTQDEFMHMVRHYEDFRLTIKPGSVMDRQVANFISSGEDSPVLWQMARQIIDVAKAKPAPRGLPFGCCARLNEWHCRYAEMRGLNRMTGEYSHFHRPRILPQAEAEFMPVVKEVLAAIPGREKGASHA